MSFPMGYDPNPLKPLITIIDAAGDTIITYEDADVVSGTPTQDYELKMWEIANGINTNHGMASVTFRDDDGDIDLDSLNGHELKIQLGKDDNPQTWFHGIIEQAKSIRPDSVRQHVKITAIGWGITTAKRIANIRRFQKRESDGLTPDPDDDDARVSELYKSLLTDSDILGFPGSGPLDINVDNVDDIDIRIPDFVRHGQTVALLLNELAETAGCYHGIDPDRNAYLRIRGAKESQFLVSADLTERNILTRNWDQDKIMYVRSTAWTYRNSTVDAGYTTIHGLGAQHDLLTHNDTSSNASLNLRSYHYAIPFTHDHDNLARVSIQLSKSGTPDDRKDMTVQIIGATSGGAPKHDDLRKTVTLSGARLEAELASISYHDIPLDKMQTTPGEKLFLRIVQYPESAANAISARYQTGTGTIYRSSDGESYSSVTGQVRMRVYSTKTIYMVGQNTVARKRHRPQETMISLDDFPGEASAILAFEGMLESLGRIRRIYDPITVTAPTTRPPLGTAVRILDPDKIDRRANLIGYTIMSSADDPAAAGGAITMTVDLEEYF